MEVTIGSERVLKGEGAFILRKGEDGGDAVWVFGKRAEGEFLGGGFPVGSFFGEFPPSVIVGGRSPEVGREGGLKEGGALLGPFAEEAGLGVDGEGAFISLEVEWWGGDFGGGEGELFLGDEVAFGGPRGVILECAGEGEVVFGEEVWRDVDGGFLAGGEADREGRF